MDKLKYIVGIDPGAFNGYAVYCKNTRKIIDIKTIMFWGLIDELIALKKKEIDGFIDLLLIIEDPTGNRPTFAKRGATNQRAINKISQNVGENKRTAKLLFDYCEHVGIKYERIVPRSSKWTKKTFYSITGCTVEASQHAIDAAKLCYGY